MPKENITKRRVDSAKPDKRDYFIWDIEVRGFGLKVTPASNKIYVLQYRMGGRESSTKRFTIGKHGSPWTPDTARDEARDKLELVRQGIDPMHQKKRKKEEAVELEFKRYSNKFIKLYARKNQLRSWRQTQRVFEHDFIPAFRGRAICDISQRDVTRVLDVLESRSPSLAKFAHAVLRKMFRWAVGRGDILVSPMADMPSPKAVASRDRVLSDVELRAVWLACEKLSHPFGPFVQFLIITGQRLREVSDMSWSEVDTEEKLWTIPAARTKNNHVHTVPLNKAAMSVMSDLRAITSKKGFVYTTTGKTPISGYSKAKKRLDALTLNILQQDAIKNGGSAEDVKFTPWRFHDLRRTMATGLQRLGTRLEVTEAILNHVSGSRVGIVGVYQRHDWADEKRRALDAWDIHLDAVVESKGKNVNVISLGCVRSLT